jgi:hypothetical protein
MMICERSTGFVRSATVARSVRLIGSGTTGARADEGNWPVRTWKPRSTGAPEHGTNGAGTPSPSDLSRARLKRLSADPRYRRAIHGTRSLEHRTMRVPEHGAVATATIQSLVHSIARPLENEADGTGESPEHETSHSIPKRTEASRITSTAIGHGHFEPHRAGTSADARRRPAIWRNL